MPVAKKKKKIILKKTIKKPLKRTAKKISKKGIKKPVKKIAKKAAKKPVKKVTKKAVRKITYPELRRFEGNPIIVPSGSASWESKATFNPTAIENNGTVHLLYRAVGWNDTSVLGYAKSKDGVRFTEQSHSPAYIHTHEFNRISMQSEKINYSSGGGWWGGAEDPRLTKIGDMVYMTYTAFNGWDSVRVAMTSISLKDFLANHWNWRAPVFISPPGQVHKNWVVFPEKVHGKYAILHGISPRIMIEYVDSLERFNGKKFIESIHSGHPLWQERKRGIRGVGPAPIKTNLGWLVFYHAMEEGEMHRFKLWAMILDADDPTKILYRSQKPILAPDEWYENNGFTPGVVYCCGAVVKPARPDDSSHSGGDGTLFIYYGGADTVSCVAVANLDLFLKELVATGRPDVTLIKK